MKVVTLMIAGVCFQMAAVGVGGGLGLEHWQRQPVLPVPLAAKAPVIDGKLNAEEWRGASVQTACIDQDAGVLDELGTEFRVMYDDEALYVGVCIRRPSFAQHPKADFPPGKHPHIWWKDDNFELVLIPGIREKETRHAYVFVGNAKGAYSEMLKPLGTNAPVVWTGKWEYAAKWQVRGNKTNHWPVWEGELKVPYAQFPGCRKPQPGTEWEMAFMNQTRTPVRRRITWSQEWSFGARGYASDTMGRLRFVGSGPSVTQKRCGRVTGNRLGNEFMFYNDRGAPVDLIVKTILYRSENRRPESAETFLNLWDMVRYMDATGEKMLQNPKMAVQAFRSRADLARELDTRYRFVDKREHTHKIAAGKRGYSFYTYPLQPGEYLIRTEVNHATTGALLYANVVPFAYFEGFDLQAFPHFLRHRKARVELDLSRFDRSGDTGRRVQVTLSDSGGKVLSKTEVAPSAMEEKVNLYVDTEGLAQGSTGTVRAALLDSSGTERHAESLPLERPPNPEWFGHAIGKSPVICPPFCPLKKIDASSVRMWERVYRMGGWGLPDSIEARGTEVLSGPISLDLRVAEGTAWQPPDRESLEQRSFSEREAVWHAVQERDGLRATMDTTLAYDGMLRYDLTLEPVSGSVTVSQLVLRIPIRREWSKYFGHHATGTRLDSHKMECKGGKVERWFAEYGDAMPFTFAFMLCGADRGIQWFCPSDRHWSNSDENKKIALNRDADGNTSLAITMIDRPKNVKHKTAYSFGLIVTPVRPIDRDAPVELVSGGGPLTLLEKTEPSERKQAEDNLRMAARLGMTGVGDYLRRGMQLFGVPRFYDTGEEHRFAAAVKCLHEADLKYVPYANWGVNASLPFFKAFGHEMLAEPYNDISYGCFAQFMGSTFPDWYLHTLKHAHETLGIDGNYMDGTQTPRLCANPLDDMGWTDEEGHPHGTYDIWGQRAFAERLYVFWHHEASRPGLIGTHTSHIPLYFITCFSDYVSSGEYHLPGRTLEEQCPLDTWMVFYCTWPHGCATRYLWWNWYKKPLLRNHEWSLAQLHDVLIPTGMGNLRYYNKEIGYGAKAKPYVRIRTVRRAFNGARFEPYWSQKAVTFEPAGPLASLWVDETRKAAYIFAANIPDTAYTGTMKLDPDTLPAGMSLSVYDAMLDQPLGSLEKPLAVDILPMRYRMITVGTRVPLPEGVKMRIVDTD
jgi:hypothetical protein